MRYFFSIPLAVAAACIFTAMPVHAQWGKKIVGRVTYGAKIPTKQKLNVDKDKKVCLAKGPVYSEDLVVDAKTKGVRDVFVWLIPAGDGGKLPIHPKLKKLKKKEVVIDQPCCQFIPHAFGIREGQTVVVKNSAPINHNVRWFCVSTQGNINIPSGKQFKITGIKAHNKVPLLVNCDIHKWMNAHGRIFNHPYYAVTKKDGTFEIPLPPAGRGKYRIMVWQREHGYLGGAAGANGQAITIFPNRVTTKNFKLK